MCVPSVYVSIGVSILIFFFVVYIDREYIKKLSKSEIFCFGLLLRTAFAIKSRVERKSLTSRPVFAVRTKEDILEAKCQNRVDARLNAHMFGRELSDYFDKTRSSRAEHAKILTATVLTVGHFLQSMSTVNLYCYVAVQEHEFFFHELIDILKKLYVKHLYSN